MLRSSLCLAFCAALAVSAAARPAAKLGAVYKSAIVTEAATGAVLFEDHADEISPPASMTKLMTFAVLDDAIRSGRLQPSTSVTVTAADAKVAMLKDSTSVWLKTGEVFTIEDLIYAMMIQSANDAAAMVARVVGGSVPAFIDLMNAKARALGMTRTTFRTPNGFPVRSRRSSEGDLTTARDFAVLSRYLVLHTNAVKYTAVKSRPFGVGKRFPPTSMTNHNHLLGKIAGVDGLKTGFTNGAGFCLATTAERGGRRIIVVVMDCPESRSRDLKVAQLIESSFATRPFVKPTISPTRLGAPVEQPAVVPVPPRSPDGGPAIKFAVPGQRS